MGKSEQIEAELKKLLPQMERITRMIEDAEQDWPKNIALTIQKRCISGLSITE